VVRDSEGHVAELLAQADGAGYLAGIPLGEWYPNLEDCFLVTVTEKRTKAEIDGLADALSLARTKKAMLNGSFAGV
jgi:glycine dehydrogenase subunit 1